MGRWPMPSARFSLIASLALAACAQMGGSSTPAGGGMAAKTAEGIPLGATGPHPVRALPDKPRFGQPVSEADLSAWNIDVRTTDGQGLPAGQGSGAEGRQGDAAQ